MAENIFYIIVLLLTFSFRSDGNDKGTIKSAETLIKEVIKSMTPSLANIHIANRNDFETGPQEFGNFKGYVEDVIIEGLDSFDVTKFDVSGFTINNITFLVKKIVIKSKYDLNGTLAFPLGQTDLPMFGNGKLSATIKNLSFSLKLEIDFHSETKNFKDLDLYLDYEKMTVHLGNLMKSKDMGKVFNNFLCRINKVIFDHYRDVILGYFKKEVESIILNNLNPNSLVKDEL